MAVYRALLRLYPKDFREEFGPDLLAVYQDLAADRGLACARRRTALDLIVTVPRYRLEHLMSEQHSTTALYVVIFGLAALGALGFVTGFGPPALLFIVAAAVVAVAQRSQLARAIRTPDTDIRHRRFRAAGVCAAVFAASIGVWTWDIGDDSLDLAGVLASLVGTAAMVGAALLAVVGLLTPRTAATA